MKITLESLTHTGKVRASNEDALWVDKPSGLFLVADGMGGHACGEVASHLAVDTISATVAAGCSLSAAIQVAHGAILAAGTANPEQQGMGTTIVAARQTTLGFELAWVGDSRIYHYGRERLTQLSVDHSFVQDMVLRGVLTQEQARNHPDNCLLRQALGKPDLNQVKVDSIKWRAVEPGILLLCSDGLSDKLSHDKVERVFINNTQTAPVTNNVHEHLQRLSEALQTEVLETSADDNFTWVLLAYEPNLWQSQAARWL